MYFCYYFSGYLFLTVFWRKQFWKDILITLICMKEELEAFLMKEETGLHFYSFLVRKKNECNKIYLLNFMFVVNSHDDIQALISAVISNVPEPLNVQKMENLHISLTKTVILKHHWIDHFIESVKDKTKYMQKFLILFDSLKIYCNEERTRTFIGLQIRTGYDSLMKIVEYLNDCLSDFNLPTFYKVMY